MVGTTYLREMAKVLLKLEPHELEAFLTNINGHTLDVAFDRLTRQPCQCGKRHDGAGMTVSCPFCDARVLGAKASAGLPPDYTPTGTEGWDALLSLSGKGESREASSLERLLAIIEHTARRAIETAARLKERRQPAASAPATGPAGAQGEVAEARGASALAHGDGVAGDVAGAGHTGQPPIFDLEIRLKNSIPGINIKIQMEMGIPTLYALGLRVWMNGPDFRVEREDGRRFLGETGKSDDVVGFFMKANER